MIGIALKLAKLAKVAFSIRAIKKSRTIKTAIGGGVTGGAIVLYPPLIQFCTDVFNYMSPVDIGTTQMGGFMLFVASVGAALLRADTDESIE